MKEINQTVKEKENSTLNSKPGTFFIGGGFFEELGAVDEVFRPAAGLDAEDDTADPDTAPGS